MPIPTQHPVFPYPKVEDIARRVRDCYIESEGDVHGFCLEVSTEIKKHLDNIGIKSNIIEGGFFLDHPIELDDGTECYDSLHYWLEIEGFIVDATATQFLDYMDHGTHIDDILIIPKESSPSHFTDS